MDNASGIMGAVSPEKMAMAGRENWELLNLLRSPDNTIPPTVILGELNSRMQRDRSRMQHLQQPTNPTTVMDDMTMQLAQMEAAKAAPPAPMQPPPTPMVPPGEMGGIAALPAPEQGYAGGGIVSFADGGAVGALEKQLRAAERVGNAVEAARIRERLRSEYQYDPIPVSHDLAAAHEAANATLPKDPKVAQREADVNTMKSMIAAPIDAVARLSHVPGRAVTNAAAGLGNLLGRGVNAVTGKDLLYTDMEGMDFNPTPVADLLGVRRPDVEVPAAKVPAVPPAAPVAPTSPPAQMAPPSAPTVADVAMATSKRAAGSSGKAPATGGIAGLKGHLDEINALAGPMPEMKSEAAAKAMEKLQTRMDKAEASNPNYALMAAGLKMASTPGGFLTALAAGAKTGLESFIEGKKGVDELEDKILALQVEAEAAYNKGNMDKYADTLNRLNMASQLYNTTRSIEAQRQNAMIQASASERSQNRSDLAQLRMYYQNQYSENMRLAKELAQTDPVAAAAAQQSARNALKAMEAVDPRFKVPASGTLSEAAIQEILRLNRQQ